MKIIHVLIYNLWQWYENTSNMTIKFQTLINFNQTIIWFDIEIYMNIMSLTTWFKYETTLKARLENDSHIYLQLLFSYKNLF